MTPAPAPSGPVTPLARAAGAALAVPFGAVARWRGKPIHPHGVLARADLVRTGSDGARWGVPWLDEPGAESGVVRLSRSAGLPAPAPDVLGLALRIDAGGTSHDLLLATTGLRPGARHVLLPRRHALRVAYGSLLPYDAAGRRVLLAALPDPAALRGVRPGDVAASLGTRAHTFRLAVASAGGPWRTFGFLTLTRDDGAPLDPPLAFDPVRNPLPGLSLARPFAALREPAYRAARAARRAGPPTARPAAARRAAAPARGTPARGG